MGVSTKHVPKQNFDDKNITLHKMLYSCVSQKKTGSTCNINLAKRRGFSADLQHRGNKSAAVLTGGNTLKAALRAHQSRRRVI